MQQLRQQNAEKINRVFMAMELYEITAQLKM